MSQCCHHWKLDTPNGFEATGSCVKCGKKAKGMENSNYRTPFNDQLNKTGPGFQYKRSQMEYAERMNIKREGWA